MCDFHENLGLYLFALYEASIPNLGPIGSLEPFKFLVGGWVEQPELMIHSEFKCSALIQSFGWGLETWTKLNNINSFKS